MPEVTDRFDAVASDPKIIPPDKEGKHPQIEATLTRLSGPKTGTTVRWFGSLHPNAQEITGKQLCAMGWDGADITALDGVGDVVCSVSETMREYQGKTRPQYSVWPKTSRPTLREDDKQSFRDRYKGLAMAMKEHVVARTPENAAPETLPEPPARNGAADVSTPTGAEF